MASRLDQRSLIHRGVGAAVLDHVRRISLTNPARTHPAVRLHAALVPGVLGHLDLRGGPLRDLEVADPLLQLGLELLAHLLLLQLDLLRQVSLRLLLHVPLNLPADVLALLLLLLLCDEVPVLDQLKIVNHLLLLELLLLDSRFLSFDGQIKLLLLRQAPDLQVPAFSETNQVVRHVLEDRIQRLHLRGRNQLLVRVDAGQVVLVEDLVLPLRDGRDGEHEPGLIRVVLLDCVDPRRDFESIEVTEEFLHQHLLARRPYADTEYDL